MHDPAIGRFGAVDPLAEKYMYNGTYVFSENKLVNSIELEGLESVLSIAMGSREMGFREAPGTGGTIFDAAGIDQIMKEMPANVPRNGIVTILVDEAWNYKGYNWMSDQANTNSSSKYYWSDADDVVGFMNILGGKLQETVGPGIDWVRENTKTFDLGIDIGGGTKGLNFSTQFGTYSTSVNNVGVFSKGKGQFDLNNVTVSDLFSFNYSVRLYAGWNLGDANFANRYSISLGRFNASLEEDKSFKLGFGFTKPSYDLRGGINAAGSIWDLKTNTIVLGN
jgi:hypothetical protein